MFPNLLPHRCQPALQRLLLAFLASVTLPSCLPPAHAAAPLESGNPIPGASSPAASPSRAALEAVLGRAEAGDPDAAEEVGGLYERGAGLMWDPPSALRWYVAAALAGRESAADKARSLWSSIRPLQNLRTQALLAKHFSDEELARVGIGPIGRERLRRYPWAAHVRAAGFAEPGPAAVSVPEGKVATTAPVGTDMGGPNSDLPPLPRSKPGLVEARPLGSDAGRQPVALVKPPKPKRQPSLR